MTKSKYGSTNPAITLRWINGWADACTIRMTKLIISATIRKVIHRSIFPLQGSINICSSSSPSLSGTLANRYLLGYNTFSINKYSSSKPLPWSPPDGFHHHSALSPHCDASHDKIDYWLCPIVTSDYCNHYLKHDGQHARISHYKCHPQFEPNQDFKAFQMELYSS